jgi:magnesium-protoporphyrin O-methyltransferase
MPCAQCEGIESEFGERTARRDLARFRRKGPRRTTRMLLDAIRATADSDDGTVLDVGGGVGTIHHLLLDQGNPRATHVDASTAYLAAAREEARRRGHEQRVEFLHGDFLDLAPGIAAADIVTLDRVVCCYPDVQALVTESASRARRVYGLVYPRDHWLARAGAPLINLLMRIKGSAYRSFVHPTAVVESLARDAGLSRRSLRRTLFWQVAVFVRDRAA